MATFLALFFGISLLVVLTKHQNLKESQLKTLAYLTAVFVAVQKEYGTEAYKSLLEKGAAEIGVKVNWVKK